MKRYHIHKLLFALTRDPDLVKQATGVKNVEIQDERNALSPLFLDLESYFESIAKDEFGSFEFADHKAVNLIYNLLSRLDEDTLLEKAEHVEFTTYSYVFKNNDSLSPFLSKKSVLYWARKPGWTVNEATLLSLGLVYNDEFSDLFDKIENRYSYSKKQFPVLTEIFERKSLLQSALDHKKIVNGDPVQYLDWLAKMKFLLPQNLVDLVFEFQGNIQTSESVEICDNKSLLKLVAAMAIGGYRFNPQAARNPATADIQSDLDKLGLGLDQKTVLKWLREATTLVNKDYLQ